MCIRDRTYTYEVCFILNGKTLPANLEDVKLRLNGKDVALKSSDLQLVDSFFVIHNVYTVTVQDANVLSDFEVEGATLRLRPGTVSLDQLDSLFTGRPPVGAGYNISSEAWFEFPAEGGMKLITSDPEENEMLRSHSRLLTEFEPGHTYLYSVAFAATDGTTINKNVSDLSVQVNGVKRSVDPDNVFYNPEQNAVAFRLLISVTIPDETIVTDLVVEDATLSLWGGQVDVYKRQAKGCVPSLYALPLLFLSLGKNAKVSRLHYTMPRARRPCAKTRCIRIVFALHFPLEHSPGGERGVGGCLLYTSRCV